MLNPDHDNDTVNGTRSKAWGHSPRPAPDDSLGALCGLYTGVCHRETVVKRKPSAENHQAADFSMKPYEDSSSLLTP